jgi:hypothetical protein
MVEDLLLMPSLLQMARSAIARKVPATGKTPPIAEVRRPRVRFLGFSSARLGHEMDRVTATVQSFLSWQDGLFAEGQIRPGNGFHTPGIDDKSAQASVFERPKLVLAMEVAAVITE